MLNIPKKMKMESKYNTKESHQTTREEKEAERTERNYEYTQKTINKMTISTYLSIIILNANRLNAPIKRQVAT